MTGPARFTVVAKPSSQDRWPRKNAARSLTRELACGGDHREDPRASPGPVQPPNCLSSSAHLSRLESSSAVRPKPVRPVSGLRGAVTTPSVCQRAGELRTGPREASHRGIRGLFINCQWRRGIGGASGGYRWVSSGCSGSHRDRDRGVILPCPHPHGDGPGVARFSCFDRATVRGRWISCYSHQIIVPWGDRTRVRELPRSERW